LYICSFILSPNHFLSPLPTFPTPHLSLFHQHDDENDIRLAATFGEASRRRIAETSEAEAANVLLSWESRAAATKSEAETSVAAAIHDIDHTVTSDLEAYAAGARARARLAAAWLADTASRDFDEALAPTLLRLDRGAAAAAAAAASLSQAAAANSGALHRSGPPSRAFLAGLPLLVRTGGDTSLGALEAADAADAGRANAPSARAAQGVAADALASAWAGRDMEAGDSMSFLGTSAAVDFLTELLVAAAPGAAPDSSTSLASSYGGSNNNGFAASGIDIAFEVGREAERLEMAAALAADVEVVDLGTPTKRPDYASAQRKAADPLLSSSRE
jgi:hypothetical protein